MAVSTLVFVRLKLRLLGNGFRGNTGRVALFVLGIFAGVYLAGAGLVLLAASAAGEAPVRLMAGSFTGAAVVLGSVLLPLVWFGIDDTLDPARFALLPLRRARLVAGLFVAALLSVPALALLVATTGLLVPAAAHGGGGAVAGQAIGLLAGLLLCVAASRAVISGFATMLRSRRVRDLAGLLLACLAALLAPLQLLVLSAAQRADWEQVAEVAAVIGWTPLGAPYTIGYELAEGRPGAAAAKLLITLAAVAGLLWWWSSTLESALAGSTGTGRRTRPAWLLLGRPGKPVAGQGDGSGAGRPPREPVAQLLLRFVPPSPFGAMVAREVRYWWRDAKRRASLTMLMVIAILVPVLVVGGSGRVTFGIEETAAPQAAPAAASPTTVLFTLLFVGTFAASALANQFGFDGTAYAAHLTAGVPGRRELRARAAAHALLTVPLLVAAGAVVAVLQGDPSGGAPAEADLPGGWATAPAALGAALAGYGIGLAVNSYLSVATAYALPESSNPFAVATGSGLSKSMLALLGIVVAYLLAAPLLIAAAVASPAVWLWLALPLGTGYGLAAAALGTHLVGRLLDRRAPELLATITPRR